MSSNIGWHTLPTPTIGYSDLRIFAKSKLQFTLGSDGLGARHDLQATAIWHRVTGICDDV
jgi:hypothetical protein